MTMTPERARELIGHTPGRWELCAHLANADTDADCECGYHGVIYGGDGFAIRALPLPSPAELLSAALELPEIKALVDEVRRFNARVIAGEVRSTKTFSAFCTALAAIEQKELKWQIYQPGAYFF